MLKKIKTILIRLIVSSCFLGLAVYMVRGKVTEAIVHLKNIDVVFLVIAVVINFLSLTVVAVRLNKILRVQKIHLSFARSYYLWTISLFFNLFLPSAVGGDIAKAYYIYKDSGKKLLSFTSVLMDRFFGLIATISIGFFAFIVAKEHIDPKIGKFLFWLAGIGIVGILLVMSRRFSKPIKSFVLRFSPKSISQRIQQLFDTLEVFRNKRIDFLINCFYSLVAQSMYIILIFFLAKSIHIELPVAVFFLLIPIVTIISMIPSVGGLGVREAAIIQLYKNYIPEDQAVALSLLCFLFIYGTGLICGILYAIRGGASIKEIEAIESDV